jgi:hypothetical protein
MRCFTAPVLTLAAVVTFSTGCGTAEVDDPSEGTVDEPLISAGGTQLYDVRNGLSVCFEQTGGIYDDLNTNVRAAVVNEWGSRVGVRFTGWKPCSEAAADVRVSYFDCVRSDNSDCPGGNGAPHVNAIGRPSDGRPNQVFLRSGYSNHWMKNNCDSTGELRECTRGYAIHEFGHILGFNHEHAHPSSTCEDDEDFSGGWMCPGGYDPDSIMNYCSSGDDRRNWHRHGLSGLDVDCARQFFFGGSPPPRVEACFYNCCSGDLFCEWTQGTAATCYQPGDYGWVGPAFNDTFARVELFGGAQMTGHENTWFDGESFNWTSSEACMGRTLRDKISSLRVR